MYLLWFSTGSFGSQRLVLRLRQKSEELQTKSVQHFRQRHGRGVCLRLEPQQLRRRHGSMIIYRWWSLYLGIHIYMCMYDYVYIYTICTCSWRLNLVLEHILKHIFRISDWYLNWWITTIISHFYLLHHAWLFHPDSPFTSRLQVSASWHHQR